jgi:hypothetical protein
MLEVDCRFVLAATRLTGARKGREGRKAEYDGDV